MCCKNYENSDKRQKYKKEYNNSEKGKQMSKNSSLLRKFKITLDEYNEMLVNQNYICAICGKPETDIDPRSNKPFALALDHCHQTNKIRGLLCSKCNKSLGGFNDNIELLQSAIDYLKKSNKIEY
jgi:hypothetical protein